MSRSDAVGHEQLAALAEVVAVAGALLDGVAVEDADDAVDVSRGVGKEGVDARRDVLLDGEVEKGAAGDGEGLAPVGVRRRVAQQRRAERVAEDREQAPAAGVAGVPSGRLPELAASGVERQPRRGDRRAAVRVAARRRAT